MWIPANEFMMSGFMVSGGFMSHGAILLDYLTFVIFGGLPGAHTISVLERRFMVGFLGHMISVRLQKVGN